MKELIDNICEYYTDNQSIGASCLVFKDNQELYSGFFGFADREAKTLMRRDSIFRLYSLTKPITATAAMILSEKGVLSLDDPVSKYFPEFTQLMRQDEESTVKVSSELKIWHLLTMTSGLPYPNSYDLSVRKSGELFAKVEAGINAGKSISTFDFTRFAADIPLSFEPGTRWDYGISADVLGGIIEKASDMTYGEFLKQSIFVPLGMDDTGFFVTSDKLDRFTALYNYTDNQLIRDNSNYLALTDYLSQPAFESGGAGLCSTIDDYSRFARMLCNGGVFNGTRILNKETVEYMTSPLLTSAQNTMWDRLKGYNYGCFMRVMTHPEISEVKTAVGEFGWDGWTGTYFNANMSNGIVILFFTQIAGAGTTWQATEISRIVYDELNR